jgi:hypothetical protein
MVHGELPGYCFFNSILQTSLCRPEWMNGIPEPIHTLTKL